MAKQKKKPVAQVTRTERVEATFERLWALKPELNGKYAESC